nr:3-deoxy-7-phosphoheptulonate synthase class II [Allosphingosinicella indica]
MAHGWTPLSWRDRDVRQQPAYPDPDALAAATRELAAYPGLVSLSEMDALHQALGEAQMRRAFLLQGGDCAESFAEFSPETIRAGHTLMDAMASLLARATGVPVIRLARLAGQFAKPRSTDPEVRGDARLPAYRGDIVNGIAFDRAARTPDPERMFRAYGQATATLSHLRSLSRASGKPIYTSHEALLLDYEAALVRIENGRAFSSAAHFLWIGDRTRFPGSAHVEFARGLANPVGIKCGPSLEPEALIAMLEALDPEREPGRVTLIIRMGADLIDHRLPPLIRAVRALGRPVLWSCDPMHGNTIKSASGYKTRALERIMAETRRFFEICTAEGAIPGGMHLEMTGQDVTECTGGLVPVMEENLGDRYHTHCDPRLNAGQALELAALVGGLARQTVQEA